MKLAANMEGILLAAIGLVMLSNLLRPLFI